MRNLKRALSLALASVMLLGMMVVGTSAATFSDEAEIVNKEAVQITAGLGLFAGSDGKFNPKGNVTRAQMATIIVKMLYGSEINADQFKGTNKFSDTAAFEGGWAEGYINLCANLGIVKGFGDGTFKPGQSLTTAEAVTMIINALGVDAGAGTWPLTVMAKAEEMKLFAELAVKPGTNEALTRDALASVVLEGLQYSPAGTTGYKVTGISYTFNTFSDALTAVLMSDSLDVTDITEVVGEDTLAKTVFDMVSVSGFVTANQATGFDYTEVNGVALNLETGLDMIGHYVTAYYAEEYESEDEPGIAYCVVDEAKYVKVDADDAVNTKKEYQSFFGTKKLYTAATVNTVDGTYATSDEAAIVNYDADNWTAPNGTYVIFEGEIIGFIAGATKSVAKVTYVYTVAGKEYIRVGVTTMQNNADEDVVNEYAGIAKDDIVIVEEANGIYTLTKVEKVEGKITRTAVVNGENVITVTGTQYKEFYAAGGNASGLENDLTTVDFEGTYAVYAIDGYYVGWDGVAAAANVSDVVYVVATYSIDGTADAYGKSSTNYYAQGVDMEGKEVSILIGIDYTDANTADLGVTSLAGGYYTFKLSTDRDAKKANIMVATGLDTEYDDSIYTVTLADGLAALDSKSSYVPVTGDIAFLASTTKFIIVDGTTAGSELDIAMTTGSFKGDVSNAPVILSQDSAGNITLEVVVIDDVVSIMADDYIVVSADQAATNVTGAAGLEYNVYFTGAGEVKAIIVEDAIPAAGIFTYSIEKDDAGNDIYTLDVVVEEAFIKYDEVFTRMNGTKLISSNIIALEAASAKIVDMRLADDIKESDVSEIATLDDLTAAKDANYQVTFTAMLDEDLENVTHIFVTDVQEIPVEG